MFLSMLLIAVWTDIRRGKIYDWLTLPAIFLGLALSVVEGGIGPLLLRSLLGALLAGGVFWVFYLFNAVGGGDVKLMAAVGALMGLGFTISALLVISLVGAFMAVLAMTFRRRLKAGLKESFKTMFFVRKRRTDESERMVIPYGVAIASGSLITWVLTILLRKG